MVKTDETKDKRDATDIVLEKPEIVKLAGKEYELKPQKVSANLEWRKKCGEICKEVVGGLDGIDLKSGGNEISIIKDFVPFLIGEGFDIAVDMMFAYSPELKTDEAKIRAEATDEEIIDAAITCFRLGFPFLKAMVGGALKIQDNLKTMEVG